MPLRALVMLASWVALASAAAPGCRRADDSGKPSAVPPLPPGELPSAPAAAAAPPSAPAALAPTPVAPPTAANTEAPAAGASITGTIVLPPATARTKPHGTLFLVARRISDNPEARGMLVAVKKLPASSFPLAFTLSAADMPFQNGPFDGVLTLTARIDQDGDPLTHEKGDVFGTLPRVLVGARGIKVPLDQVQKETESLAGGAAPIPGQGAGGPMGLPPGHP